MVDRAYLRRMTTYDDTNTSLPSPTWGWRKVRIPAVPPPGGTARSGAEARFRLHARRMQEPLTITVKYQGGSEAWITIQFRTIIRRFPGHMDLLSVVQALNEDRWVSGRERKSL